MVQYASGSLRISGLGSDYNFDEMIDKLYQVEQRQATQFLRWKSDWQTRLDALKEVRGGLMNLQTALNKLNTMDKFLIKSTTSTQPTVAVARAESDAVNTAYTVEVNRLAAGSTWTKDTGLATAQDVISASGGSIKYSYQGKSRTVTVPAGTTVEGLLKIINNDSGNPGVRAQTLQSANGVIFQLRGMDTGRDNILVIESTSGLSGLGIALDPATGNYDTGENFAEFKTTFSGLGDVINSSGEEKTFIYSVDGVKRTVYLPDGAVLQNLVDGINAQTPGVAYFDTGTGKFGLRKDNTVYTPGNFGSSVTASGVYLNDILGLDAAGAPTGSPTLFDSITSKVLGASATPADATTFTFDITASDGSTPSPSTVSIDVNENTTLEDLRNALRTKLGARADVQIELDTGTGKYFLKMDMKDTVHRLTVADGTLTDFAYVPPSPVAGSGWDVRQAENAQVRINGYPADPGKWLEVSSNTLESGKVVPGMSFTLLDTGTTTISVGNDIETMKENIYAFVDAVNTFRSLLSTFTKVDDSKEVLDPEYAVSQFEMQKGGVLTGNYGVQLVESRLKEAVSGTAKGFVPRDTNAAGNTVGDVFSSLSQIGIYTNATEGEATFGLLTVNLLGDKGSLTLDQALADDPEAVARLFTVRGEGSSNSDDFQFDSMITGITKAGTYDVSYEVDASGNILNAFIGGKAAIIDNTNHTITANEGDSKGLLLSVTNLTPSGTPYNGSVSVKEGKIGELLSLMEGTEGMLGTNGTLKTIEDNYGNIIDGIDEKIKREDERLSRWERNMILKFSRLEATLARYQQMQTDLTSQIAQLPKGSSSSS
ncbi:MAG: flagellar filament capping protein FliD [Desulfovibrio sp.]|jgi:flagellar hook-associated protein 2|nr:flagellar filament capping protein FliD [Desulfovibrio sp.]